MNDKKEKDILEKIKSNFGLDGKIQRDRRIWVYVDKKQLIDLCTWSKKQGFVHLSTLSVTDWLEEGKYEITYHLWSYKDKILLTLKTKIDRNKPIIESVKSIWGNNAQIHERELHELFGVKFEGNNDLAPLFLDDWQGPAPFRKDFDWREYVQEKYYSRENERESVYYD